MSSIHHHPVTDLGLGTAPGSAIDATGLARGLVRLRDIVLSVVGLVLGLPVLFAVAVAIRIDSPGPAIFHHERVGRFGSHFRCVKLRTMVDDAEDRLDSLLASDTEAARQFAERHKLDRDPRVTRVGRWLRKLNIDEVPQLWNVLKGEMSLVGPRPIVDDERPRYGAALTEVLSVRPGMTGLWQVSGRSEVSYEERVGLDLTYVRQRTFLGDLGIMVRTVWLAVRGNTGGC